MTTPTDTTRRTQSESSSGAVRPEPSPTSGSSEALTVPSMLTVAESSQLLGISLRSAYRAAESGQLPTMRLGRRVFVPTRRLLSMLGMDARDLASALQDNDQPAIS